MPTHVLFALLMGSLLAACGQLMFKLGATGRETLMAFVNLWICGGLIAYASGTILWIYSLSKAKLFVVFPFTALTFVLVYILGGFLLDETVSARGIMGIALVLAGLYFVTTG